MKAAVNAKKRWIRVIAMLLSLGMLSMAAYAIYVGSLGLKLLPSITQKPTVPVLIAASIVILIVMLLPSVMGICVILRNEDGEEVSTFQQNALAALSIILALAGTAAVVWMVIKFDFEISLMAKVGAVAHCLALGLGCFARHCYNVTLDVEYAGEELGPSGPVYEGVIIDVDAYDVDAAPPPYAEDPPISVVYADLHQSQAYAPGTPTVSVEDLNWDF